METPYELRTREGVLSVEGSESIAYELISKRSGKWETKLYTNGTTRQAYVFTSPFVYILEHSGGLYEQALGIKIFVFEDFYLSMKPGV